VSTYNRVVAADETASLAPAVRARLATEMADPASDVGASLSGTFVPQSGSRTTVLGDSVDASPKGWFPYFTIRGSIPVARNAGVGGERLDQHSVRFGADVAPYAPDIVIFGGATNDLSQGRTDSDIRASIETIADKIAIIGAIGVVRTSPPTDNAATTGTVTDHRQRIMTHNAWLKNWAMLRGVTVLDIHKFVVDPLTGGYTSGQTDDGTHPNEAAYSAIADGLLVGGLPKPFRSEFSLGRIVTDASNMFPNGVCALDTSGNGLPDSWAKAGVTVSLVSEVGIVGKWLHVVNSAAGAGLVQLDAPGTSFDAGDHVQIAGRVKASAATWTTPASEGVRVILQFVGGGIQINIADYVHEGLNGIFSYEQIVPAGTTAIRFQLYTIGKTGETVDVAELAGRNITRLRA